MPFEVKNLKRNQQVKCEHETGKEDMLFTHQDVELAFCQEEISSHKSIRKVL